MRSLNGSKLFAAKCIGAAFSVGILLSGSLLMADEPPKKEEHKKAPAKSERPARAERPARTEAPAARTTERPARTETPAPRTRNTESTPAPRTTTVAPERTRESRPMPADNRGGFQGSDRTRNSNAGPARGSQPAVVRGSSGRVESYRTNNGAEARFRPDGRVQTIRSNDMVITHGAGGSRRIVVERADRTVIVTNNSGHGYVQRPFVYGRTEMVTRTYYVRGVVHNSYYRPYVYRGISLNVYVPVRYYTPAFYGYVYAPWVTPVRYSWGWSRDPWYGYYGGYFAPAPYYPSASLWLTDYMISARLADAYADQANRAAQAQSYRDAQGGPALSPAVKQEIAAEVQRQLDMERTESQAMSRNSMPDPNASGLPSLLGDGLSHVFIVSYNLDVNDSNGQPCSLTRGDVIRLSGAPSPNSESAYLQVAASKGGDCRQGSNVIVALADLQDTLNQMRESINQGMGELQNNSGRNGMPVLPRGAAAPAVTASFVQSAPLADPQVAAELQQQVQEAQKVEQDVVGLARQEDTSLAAPQGFSNNAPPAPSAPVTIGLDMTIAQVVDSMGSPKQIVDLGPKQIYVYQNMKIVFMNGKVSDVQ